MKFINFKISRKCIFPIGNIAHVRSRKTFYHISAHFRNPGFRSVSKPRKPVFIFRTGPTTNIYIIIRHQNFHSPSSYGVEQRVMKSMTLCSISRTVVPLPCITVKEGARMDLSYGMPPLNITYGSLKQTRHTFRYTVCHYFGGYQKHGEVPPQQSLIYRNIKS